MASLRLHLANFILRYTVKRRLGKAQTPEDVRKIFNPAAPSKRAGVTFKSTDLGGVSGEWAVSKTAENNPEKLPTLLYLHGGAYIAMSPKTHRPITGAFANRGFRVFAADYRLAPENPFPAAVEDALACWRALRRQTSGPIVVAGDSAGGGLTLALLLALRDAGEDLPAAACVFSPWTDLALTGASLRTNRTREAMLSVDGISKVTSAYLNGADPRAPLASPLYGDFSGIPPLIIFVGDTEILLDDSVRLAARAQAAGVVADLRIYPGTPHVWQALNAILPEAKKSMDEAAAFLSTACALKSG